MKSKNYAFIDGNNLYLGAKSQDIELIVTSDGDFACLMRYLSDNDKLKKIITPTERFSKLLKPFVDNILPLKTIKNQIKKK